MATDFKRTAGRLIGVAVCVALMACAPRLDTRGNLPDPDQLTKIKPGEHTRIQVAEILGSPSNISTFDQETWYYVSQQTETTAFFEADVKTRQVLILRFDKGGMLADIRTIGLEEGRTVLPVERVTPTSGNEITIIEQLLGNVGKFNK
jgi:outer membrane protein assembly factor BamE (lipoprotein component of BamABCDE complex)